MSLNDDVEELTGEFITKTDRAILIKVEGNKEWFPLSQISIGGEFQLEAFEPGDEIAILVPVWLLRKRGL